MVEGVDYIRAQVCALWDEGRTQGQIADRLEISSQEAGRIITWARHRGIIALKRDDVSLSKQREIWELHCQGRSYGQIELATGVCKPKVKHVINRRYYLDRSDGIAKQDCIGAVS